MNIIIIITYISIIKISWTTIIQGNHTAHYMKCIPHHCQRFGT